MRAQGLHLEGDRACHGLQDAVREEGEAGLVAPRNGQGPLGAVVPGIPLTPGLQLDGGRILEAEVPDHLLEALFRLSGEAPHDLPVG